MSTLLITKLHKPAVPPKRVLRPSLIQHLNEGLESGQQVILVSAPAGFGKTTCISDWVDTLEMPFAWLSLDSGDDDPGRFFTYLIAALQNIDLEIGAEIEGILRAGQLPPEDILSTTLVNDILKVKQRFLLVLDDLQMVQDASILRGLETLIANPPESLYLVLLTREDPSLPLARLRANNQLTEVRAGNLRFTSLETEQYLNVVMGLSLSADDIQALEEKTEGWAAGLHLAGLSIRGRRSPSEFIAKLSGSQRFILNYLTEEVLNQQSDDIQQFLLETSILDKLSDELCNAVTGRTDSHDLLEKLFSANLFLIPLDEEGHWYRYHQLFVDLLQDRLKTLQKDQTIELHQRASQWYRQKGFVSEAIQHALDAEDYTTAVHLIESHAMDMLMQWHLKTVEGWMQSIPQEWTAQSPQANLTFAWMYLMRSNHERAFPYLERLGALFANPQANAKQADLSLQARWLALQSMLLNAQGQQAASLQACQAALELAPKDDNQLQGMIYLSLANTYQQMNDYDRAVEAYQKLIQLGQMAGNSVSELIGVSGLALLALQHGQYHFAFDLVTQGIQRIQRAGALPPISTAVYGELAVIHYQWHQLEQAHTYFQRAIQVSTLSGYSDAELYYGVILSRLSQIQGDLASAAKKIQKAVDLMQVEAPAAVREEVLAQQVRIYLAQDNLAAAEMLLKNQGVPLPAPSREDTRASVLLKISSLRVLLYRAQRKHELDNLESGLALANQLVEQLLQGQYIPPALETLLIRAQLQAALGDSQASQADYVQALKLGEPEGFISIFVEEGPSVAEALSGLLKQANREFVDADYVQRILDAFPVDKSSESESKPEPVSIQESLIVPLSKRELEILQLIDEGLSNQEITERLVITLHTVKKHSSNIYAKLGVSSRTQAVARARQLGLL